jgi:hypothetical protein
MKSKFGVLNFHCFGAKSLTSCGFFSQELLMIRSLADYGVRFSWRPLPGLGLFPFQLRLIFIEKFLHERRIKVRPDFNDLILIEPADSAVPVAERGTVESG